MIGIVDSARLVTRARDRESALFQVLGGWVPTTDDPHLKLVLARAARRHAWHAQLWERVLPVLHDIEVEPDVTNEGDAVVAALRDAGTGSSRIGAYAQAALPWLIADYARWRSHADPVSDGPVLWTLGLVVRDEEVELDQVRVFVRR